MKIAVFGAGGVGGYFGGRLAQAGEDVVFIARGAHLLAMQAGGLHVESFYGDFVVDPVQATDTPAEVGAVDAVLVCVKAWQVSEAAEAIRPMVGPGTLVVPLQNGVEAPDELIAVLGDGPVIGGLCGLISYVAGPGHIRHAGAQPYIQYGELDNSRSPRVDQLHAALSRTTGVRADNPDDIHAAIWRKFTLIASWSGVGSVTRAPLGAILGLPDTRELIHGVMQEVVAVAQARGVALPAETADQVLAFLDGFPPDGTASMQRDVMAGRPSELASQNGAVMRLGQEAGVPTPLNRFIYQSLLPSELAARGELAYAN